MRQINLKGSAVFLTEDAACSYLVTEGTILVFAAGIKNGEPGRRMFMAEMPEGSVIPALHHNSAEFGEWIFVLTGLGNGSIREQEENPEQDKYAFAKRINLKLADAASFPEEILEKVNLRLITEEGYIYAVDKEQQSTYQKGLFSILQMFAKKKHKYQSASADGNLLYNTVARVCEAKNIRITSFDNIKETCGRRFDVWDIARVSHYINRQVLLDEGWYEKDAGSLLVFDAESSHPLACIAVGTGKYVLHDCETGVTEKLTSERAQTISPSAYAFYAAFENKIIKVRDILSFGMKSIHLSDIWNILLFSLFGTLIGLLIPFLNEKIFDSYIPLGDSGTLLQIGALMLAFIAGNLGFTIVKNMGIFRCSNSMEVVVQSAVFDRLYSMPMHIYSKYDSADLAKRALGISAIFKLLSEVAITTTITAVFSLLYLFRMFKYSPKLAKMGMLLVLCNMVIAFAIGCLQIKYERKITENEAKASSVMYQLLSGISKIRIAGVENRALLQYLEPYLETKKIHIKNELLENLAENINLILGVAFTGTFYGMMVVKKLNLSIGEFTAFTAAFGSFSAAMITVVVAFLQVNNAIPIYDRAKVILETPNEFEEDAVMPGHLEGKIDVDNLSFRYSREGETILKDISFSIRPKEYVGIVGSSGSGKSTLLKILLGFEQPTVGKIYFDDKDIDSLDKRELRRRFGVVLQDGQLISGSIYENIVITAANITNKQVMQIIRDVGLEQDIAEMPMGLHTVIAEGAGTISGGQRQRILIARAIVNRPDILFFDEATSALDNVNQALVCESLERLNATRVVIAHRLSTVINCDRIIVLEEGRIAEQGSYQELMEQKGRFYDLTRRQIM